MVLEQLNNKYRLLYYILLILFSINNTNTFSQNSNENKKRPRIGLALSGGGAKGLAHIGVLKMLEKYNIPIDYITGTSMGSVVGGLYAIGYSADEIEIIAKEINWTNIFEGKINRKVISVEEKNEADKYLLEFPIEKGKIVLPKGVVSGQRLEMLLARLTWSVHGQNDFSKFQIPFKCIATDIETGDAFVIDHGYLPDAIRASMSIPSVFTPIEIDNKLLVDGGLVRNLPASDLKEMGADIIIGSDVGAPLYKKDEISSMLAIMDQASSFRNIILSENEKKLCDILIKPDISKYGASSFDAIDSLIKNGEKATLELEDKLIALSKKLETYNTAKNEIKNPAPLYSIFIDHIEVVGIKKVSLQLILSNLNIKDSSWVNLKKIEKGVEHIFGTQFFEKVNYRIIQKKEKTILIIRVQEKPFSQIRIGANYNKYLNASLLINGTFRNIIGDGSKLILSAKLSSAPEFKIDYSIFTKYKPSIGFKLSLNYFNLIEKIYLHADSINLSLNRNSFIAKTAIVSSLSNSVYIETGTEIDYRNFNILEYHNPLYELNLSYFKLFGNIYIDTYDRTDYPNSGIKLHFRADYIIDQLVNTEFPYNNNFWKFDIAYKRFYSIGKKFNFNYDIYGAVIPASNTSPVDKNYIGGDFSFKSYIFPLTGFRFMEFTTNNLAIAGVNFRYEPWNNKFIFIHSNGAFISDDIEQLFNETNFLFGAGIGIAAITIIGPVEFKISKNNRNERIEIWLKVGYKF